MKTTKEKIIYILASIGIISIVFIGVPTISGIIVSVDGPHWLETNNEWIGYWGGYLGAIIGGLVTLYVMRETNKDARKNLEDSFKEEKQRMAEEKRRKFNDEILDLSFDYYIKIISVLTDLDRGMASREMRQTVEKILIMSEMLSTKLKCKNNCEGYKHCIELSNSIMVTKVSLQKTIEFINKKDKQEEMKEAIKETNRLAEILHSEITSYYIINEKGNL